MACELFLAKRCTRDISEARHVRMKQGKQLVHTLTLKPTQSW